MSVHDFKAAKSQRTIKWMRDVRDHVDRKIYEQKRAHIDDVIRRVMAARERKRAEQRALKRAHLRVVVTDKVT